MVSKKELLRRITMLEDDIKMDKIIARSDQIKERFGENGFEYVTYVYDISYKEDQSIYRHKSGKNIYCDPCDIKSLERGYDEARRFVEGYNIRKAEEEEEKRTTEAPEIVPFSYSHNITPIDIESVETAVSADSNVGRKVYDPDCEEDSYGYLGEVIALDNKGRYIVERENLDGEVFVYDNIPGSGIEFLDDK